MCRRAPASRVGGPKAAWLLWPRPWPRLGRLPTTQYSYLTSSCSSNLRLYPFPYPCASTTLATVLRMTQVGGGSESKTRMLQRETA